MFRSAIAILWFCLMAAQAPAWAQDSDTPSAPLEQPERILLILDSSGSMWGQIDGIAKYEIARDVIADLLGDWDSADQLGLMAYGHRREGDCADIETLVPVGPFESDPLVSAVQLIRPLGKTPITDALRQGAGVLNYTTAPGTIILLTDGLETCNGDPCAMARELAEAGVNLRAHVIGFDLGDEDISSLRCIADETGGMFLSADTAGELSDAFETVIESTLVPRNVTIRAIDAASMLVEDAIGWNVYAADTGARVFIGLAPAVDVALAPGAYRVTARRGDTNLAQEFEVPADEPVLVEVMFATGTVQLNARLAPGVEPYGRGLSWNIFDASGERMAREAGDAVAFTLPVGGYRGLVKSEDLEVSFDVTFLPDQVTAQTIDLNAGLLTVSGLGPTGAAVARHVSWQVFPSEQVGGRAIARELRRSTTFLLAAGRYRVVGTYQGETLEFEVQLDAGAQLNQEQTFSAP